MGLKNAIKLLKEKPQGLVIKDWITVKDMVDFLEALDTKDIEDCTYPVK